MISATWYYSTFVLFILQARPWPKANLNYTNSVYLADSALAAAPLSIRIGYKDITRVRAVSMPFPKGLYNIGSGGSTAEKIHPPHKGYMLGIDHELIKEILRLFLLIRE